MIRVLVVEDSLTSCKIIKEALQGDPEIIVAGEASGGAMALEMIGEIKPDIITTDILMPGMDGSELTEELMKTTPLPVMLLTSAVDKSSLFKAYDALLSGAVDAYEKPTFLEMGDRWKKGLISRVRAAASADVNKALNPISKELPPFTGDWDPSIVAVGASAGGVRPLVEFLQGLSHDFPLPVLAVLNMAGSLSRSFADWLEDKIKLVPVTARGGESIHTGAGIVFFAPADKHLKVEKGHLILDESPPIHGRIPSIDALFLSLSEEMPDETAALMLSGTGDDGLEGFAALENNGAYVACQDPETLAVQDTCIRTAPAEILTPALMAERLNSLAM